MNLTPSELRAVKKIEKEENSHRFSRYIFIFLGLLNIALAIRIAYTLWQSLKTFRLEEKNELMLLTVSFSYPLLLLSCGAATAFFIKAGKEWNGRPERTLLLKLYSHLNTNKPTG